MTTTTLKDGEETRARHALADAREVLRRVYLAAVLAEDIDLPAADRIALAHRVEFAAAALPQRGGAR